MRRRAEAAGVGSALAMIALSFALAAWVVVVGSSDSSVTTTAAKVSSRPASGSLPPSRNPRALMLAKRSGAFLVGLAAVPGGPVEVRAFPGPESHAADGLTANANGRPVLASSCGRNCFRVSAASMTGTPVLLSLRFQRKGARTVTLRFRLPARLPPDGSALLEAANRLMGALQSVQYDEELTSGGTSGVETHYAMQAPDRIRFRTSSGRSTILIGKRRWDREGTKRWIESPFPGVRVPTYGWEGARNVRLLGRTRLAGVPASVLAAVVDASVPAWFRIFVADDGRVLEAEMLTESHFMHHRFSDLDKPVRIEPPG